MVRETNCVIHLNSIGGATNNVYFSGQSISGNVVLSLYEKQIIKEAFIQILGIGKCKWSEQRRSFNAEEIYLKDVTKLFKSTTDLPVATGVYTFPFACDLPKDSPTSYEGQFGFIRYLAIVHIVRPSLPDKTYNIAFTVIKPYNLNAEPIFQFPATKQRCIKFFRFLTLKSNNLTITATIPTSGYAPGQAIPIQLDVNNKSNRSVVEFKIELNKVIVYFDAIPKNRKKHKKLLTTVIVSGCPANNSSMIMPEIIVPPVPSTDVLSSKILHITYEIKIYGTIGDQNDFKPLITLPVTIGTVPLYSTYRCVHFEDSAENNHIEPLKYEAFTDDLSDEKKCLKFAPVYPVYRMRVAKKCRKTSERDSESSL